jgi:hypothetical protein
MKKLTTIVLGFALATTTVAVTFGQDAGSGSKETSKKKKKKSGKKKEETPKKDSGR